MEYCWVELKGLFWRSKSGSVTSKLPLTLSMLLRWIILDGSDRIPELEMVFKSISVRAKVLKWA